MSAFVLYWVVTPLAEVAAGVLISFLIVRWLPLRARGKRLLYRVIAILIFTPVLIPITAAGAVIIPALLLGFAAFTFNPAWNSAFLLANVCFAFGLSSRLFADLPEQAST